MSFRDNFKTIIHDNYHDTETYDLDDIIINNTSIETQNGKLRYLLFDFEKEISPGQYERVYKAIKLVKIKRVPKKDLTLGSFLQMQEGVVTGYYQNQINYIQIFANIIHPKRLGLIYAYGCQGISSNSIQEAKHFADMQMEAIEHCITGTFRTLEYVDLTADDARWIFQKLSKMDDMRILRGVPGAKKTQGRITSNTFFMGSNDDVEEQAEEFLMGMDEYEYLFVLTATSVDMEVISRWKEQYLKESTYWASLRNGTKSMQFGLSMPMVYAANIGTSEGWGSNTGEKFGESWGENQSHSVGTNESFSEGTSHSLGTGTSHGTSTSLGGNVGQSSGSSFGENIGRNESTNIGQSSTFGTSNSTSHTSGTSESFSEGSTSGETYGTSHNISSGTSGSIGTSSSTSSTTGTSYSTGTSQNNSIGMNSGWSAGTGHSSSTGVNGGGGIDFLGFKVNGGVSEGSAVTSNSGVTGGSSWGQTSGSSQGWSSSNSVSNSHSVNSSQGWSNSISEGTSQSTSFSNSNTHSMGTSESNSVSSGVSTSQGNTFSQGYGNSYGQSTSANIGASKGVNWGNGTNESYSTSESFSENQSHSVGSSVSDSTGSSYGVSTGKTIGNSVSGGTSAGSSSSMGIGPNISFGRTFMWEDREVSHILDLLNYSTNRIIMASNGAGMWFTDIYIATESEKAASAATGLAMSSWHDKNTLTSPLQVYKPSDEEKEYLFKHLSVFSPSIKREGVPGQFESYKYSTLLLNEEIAAFSHPPRANIGGIQAAIDDPPILTIPSDRQNGEIFLGYIGDTEKYSKKGGYKSKFKYTLRTDELHHAYISGASRSGKTVAARRLVAEAYANVRLGEKKKRPRFLIMDPKQDWRALAKIIPNKNFRFYSLSDPTYHPIHLNLLKIPCGVYTERYADKLREIFIRSYGLGDRGFQILGKAIRAVYRKAGCFDEDVKYNKKDEITGLYPATERSKGVTLEDVCKQLENEIMAAKQRDKQEAIQRILDRMESFNEPESSIYTVFCNRGDGMGIDDLLGADDVIVLESYGMDTKTSSFIFGLITSGVYQYAVSNGGFIKPENQYQTILVIEEANQVLLGNEDNDNLGGANPFEIILDQSAGYGLFIWTLTQKIASMPDSVLANSAIKIIGRQDREQDIKTSIVQIGKDAMIADRVFKNWFPDQPTGWFIVKSSRNMDFTKNAPTHVLVEYLDIEPPTDEELENILELGEMERTAELNGVSLYQ